jgi:anti-anti-sigma factor
MNVTVTNHDGYVLAKTEGDLDESARSTFRELLHPLVGEPGTQLIIDLGGSKRITSAGVSHLVTLVADANTRGSRVTLCHLSPFVAEVIAVTKLDKYLDIAPDVASARVSTGRR